MGKQPSTSGEKNDPDQQGTRRKKPPRPLKKNLTRLVGLGIGSALLTGCAGTNVAPNESAKAVEFKACLLTLGNAPAGSANAEAKLGLESAQKLLGISVSQVQIKEKEEIQKTVDQQISQNCNVILGVGEAFGETIVQKSKIYRDRDFALLVAPGVDTKGTRDNIQIVGFDLTQPAYVAGYVAAGTTTTHRVGVISDQKTPARRAIVAAFAQGVARYNQKHKTDKDFQKITVNATPDGDGLYLGEPIEKTKLEQATRKMVKQKTDVIFLAMDSDNAAAIQVLAACNRIKGSEDDQLKDRQLCPELVKATSNPPSGLEPKTPSLENKAPDSESTAPIPETTVPNSEATAPDPAAKTPNLDPNAPEIAQPITQGQDQLNALSDFTAIWYGNDGVKTQKRQFKTGKPPILSSVVMGINEAVVWTIRDAKNHRFYLNNTQVLGNFKNHGVGLAPFYDYDATVPNQVKNEAQKIIEEFRVGTLKVKMPQGSYLPGQNP